MAMETSLRANLFYRFAEHVGSPSLLVVYTPLLGRTHSHSLRILFRRQPLGGNLLSKYLGAKPASALRAWLGDHRCYDLRGGKPSCRTLPRSPSGHHPADSFLRTSAVTDHRGHCSVLPAPSCLEMAPGWSSHFNTRSFAARLPFGRTWATYPTERDNNPHATLG